MRFMVVVPSRLSWLMVHLGVKDSVPVMVVGVGVSSPAVIVTLFFTVTPSKR